jgi:hypothetical protein
MNYTKIYKEVYKNLEPSGVPHEVLHYSCLRITDALQEVYLHSQKNNNSCLDQTLNVIEYFVKNNNEHDVI